MAENVSANEYFHQVFTDNKDVFTEFLLINIDYAKNKKQHKAALDKAGMTVKAVVKQVLEGDVLGDVGKQQFICEVLKYFPWYYDVGARIPSKYLRFKSYLAQIEASIGSTLFQHYYALDLDDQEFDVLEDGELSCGSFVSQILLMSQVIDKPCALASSTIRLMKKAGWLTVDIDQREKGDILVWEKQIQGNQGLRLHIGFYMGGERAISNSTSRRVPVEHSDTYDDTRAIIEVLRYPNW